MVIKGYTIIREINRGPITTVYQARQEALDRSALLKILNVQWKNERDLIARFRREAKICARLHHPNIVTVYDFGTGTEQFYISMEFVEGQSLADLIRDYAPLPIAVVVYLIYEILNGLDYAHRHGVIHRDIKPSNIMLSADGAVKISDFGMAMISGIPGITEQGDAVGSPAYISPEQALGKEITANSDLFSLGVTIYEMINGSSPFKGANIAESINKTLNEEPLPLNVINKGTPDWLSQMVAGMLQKKAKDRVADCAQLLEQLQGVGQTDAAGMAAYLKNPQPLNVVADPVPAEALPVPKRKWIYGFVAVLFVIGLILFVNQYRQNGLMPPPFVADSLQEITQENPKENPPAGELTIRTEDKRIKKPQNKTINKTAVPESNRRMNRVIAPGKEKHVNLSEEAGLFVICNPWAEIYVDGEKIDTTPLNEAFFLTAGFHSIELKNPNYKTYLRRIELNDGQTDTLRVTLLPQSGALELRVHPWAKVYIDNAYYETTPLTKPIALTAGIHVLRYENPNFAAIRDTVEIISGETIQKRVRFGK